MLLIVQLTPTFRHRSPNDKKTLPFESYKIMNGQNPLYGVLFMLINTVALAGLDIAVKILRIDLYSGLIVFLYKFSLLIIILPWVLKDGLKRLHTKRIMPHMLRSIFSVAGALCFYHGLYYVNMADAAALENLQYLLVATIGMIFFQESRTKTKIAAILIAFFGAIIVVNPEILELGNSTYHSEYNKGHIYIVLAILCWSCNTITVKLLTSTEHNKTQMFYLLLCASIISIPPAFVQWNQANIFGFDLPLSPQIIDISGINLKKEHFLLLGMIASCYFVHAVAYFNALKSELSVVIPFRYTKLIFSGALGYLIFNEQHQNASYLGYALIIFAGLLLVRAQIRKMALDKKSKAKEESECAI